MGLKSKPPRSGILYRIGAKIGSVARNKNCTNGLYGSASTQEMITRATKISTYIQRTYPTITAIALMRLKKINRKLPLQLYERLFFS